MLLPAPDKGRRSNFGNAPLRRGEVQFSLSGLPPSLFGSTDKYPFLIQGRRGEGIGPGKISGKRSIAYSRSIGFPVGGAETTVGKAFPCSRITGTSFFHSTGKRKVSLPVLYISPW